MKKAWKLGLGVAAMFAAVPAMAADHQDGTISAGGALSDPTTDITDVFSWMSSDGNTVNLVMDVFPGASSTSMFSTSAKYVFHTYSAADIVTATHVKRDIVCTFTGTTAPQTASCWVTDGGTSVADYVTGNASVAATPLTSVSTKMKVFAGPRNDPFFFNLAGFRNASSVVASAIKATVGGSTAYIKGPDTASPGCPILTTAARNAIVGKLTTDCIATSPPKDFFRVPVTADNVACVEAAKPALVTTLTQNQKTSGIVLSLVVTVDKSLMTTGGSTLGVWAATTK